MPALRFHDVRHFAGTMAAAAGASIKEVMARGGSSSPQMALRYEHAGSTPTKPWAEARPRGGTLVSPARDFDGRAFDPFSHDVEGRRRNSLLIIE
jgi:hypothetical protein